MSALKKKFRSNSRRNILSLYQFPISHFCEKARWALDYKNLEHSMINMLPGLHAYKIKKLGENSQVPLLKHNDRVVQGSGKIIDYLDSTFTHNTLTPDDLELRKKATQWEYFADNKIGPQVRLVTYHILLDYPEIVIPMMTQDGPLYGPLLMKKFFPVIQKKMREQLNIDANNAAKSNSELLKSVDDLANHYANHEFMVGDRFSRADLTAAALLAPIAMPSKYGVNWPDVIPERMLEFSSQFDGKLGWLKAFYRHYR